MTEFIATIDHPDQNYIEKVQKSIEYNDPSEVEFRAGRVNAAAREADEIEVEQREVVSGDATYVLEDREDGVYAIASQQGTEPIRPYGDAGLKLDVVPQEAQRREPEEQGVFDRIQTIAKETREETGEIVEGVMRGIGLGTTKFVTNIIRSAVDNPIGDFVIGEDKVEAFEQFSTEFLENAEKAARKSGITGKEFGTAGQISKTIGDVTGQFVQPAAGLYLSFRAMGAGALLSSVLADGTVGFFGVSPETENIANLIPEDSEAFGALRDLIATDPDDPEFENRSKNALEAIALLGVGEAAVRGIIETVKTGKKAVQALELPENIGRVVDDLIGGKELIVPGENFDLLIDDVIKLAPPERELNRRGKNISALMTPAETKFFDDMLGTTGEREELFAQVPSLKISGFDNRRITINDDDLQGLFDFIEETVVFERAPGGPGANLLPPSFNRGDFVDKLKTIFGIGGLSGAALLSPEEAEASGKTELLKLAGRLLTEPRPRPIDIVPDVRAALKDTGNASGIDFNLARMETTNELDNLIDEISEIYKEPIKAAKRGKETFSQTQAKADMALQMGFDVDEVISRQPGQLWPAHKIKAARDIFVSELQKTEALARAIKAGDNTSENLIAFRRQLSVVSAVQSQIKGVQTETARALSQYRMTAKTAMEVQVNLAEMIQKSGGADMNETLVDAYLNVIEMGGPDAAATFARNAEQVTGWDMLYESWINSLLGSPTTHAVNMIGNSLTINQAVIERYAAATYATAERGVKRTLGKDATQGITFSEANAFAQGQAMAVNDAMVAMMKAFKAGESSDTFGKIDYHSAAITTQNINELPLSKTITSKMMQGDELVQSNSQLAKFIDFMGEYYYRAPGRFLMAEDELFKTMNYRAELHALAARESFEEGLSKEAQVARLNDILADPQVNAPELHRGAFDFAREQTFTTPPGETAQSLRNFLNNGNIGNFPAGRVVVPFFNVINNITKFVGGRVPGAGLINPNSKTYKDFFSPDPATRQLVMGKWAAGSSLLGFGAWSSMNGISTGRITDNNRMLRQIETTQKKTRYSIRIPGTDRMMNYNRLEPAGMLMAIAADTANALAYLDNEEERQSVVLAATAAIVPYMQDKSFFDGISRFMEAFNPQFGSDKSRTDALARYLIQVGKGAPGAVLGPLAPATPLSGNIKRNIFMDRARRVATANNWSIEQDSFGDDILVANSETYRNWQALMNKIYAGTPGLSATLPADVNIWGEDIIYEGGLGPDIITPIYTNTPTVNIKELKGHNFPAAIEAGRFRGMLVGSDLTLEQHQTFVGIVGIDGELERLNMPLTMPRRDLSARINGKNVGLPVRMNPGDRIDLIKIMNSIRVVNNADGDKTRMNLRETLNWMIKQPEYAILPDNRDARGAKADMINKVYNEFKGASIELFFAEHPRGQLYFRKSVEMQQKAQNTGVQ